MLQPDISDDDVRNAAIALMEPKEEKKPINRAKIVAKRKTFHSEVFNALSHKNRAKAIYRQMDIELLKWTKEQLDEILVDKEQAELEKKEKEQNRHKVIEQLNELLQANDTTLKELYPDTMISEPEKKPRGPYKKSGKPRLRTYKFKCHIFDRDYYWAGSGYIPTAFRCHLAKGHTIDSCYLPEDQWLKTHEKVDQIIPEQFQNTAEKLINEANKQKIAKTRSELSFHD